VYFIMLPFLVRKIFTFYINDVLLFKCPFPGPNGYGLAVSDAVNFPTEQQMFQRNVLYVFSK